MSFIHQAKINDTNYDIIGSCYYGTSSTAAGTAAKVATVSNADGFVLVPGVQVAIKFTTANSASSPTLNVNSTGAKTIKYRGAAITSSAYYWAANQVVTFVYDGEAWQTTDYLKNPNSDTKATTSLTSTDAYYPAIFKYTTTKTDSPTTTLRYGANILVNPGKNEIKIEGDYPVAINSTTIGGLSVEYSDDIGVGEIELSVQENGLYQRNTSGYNNSKLTCNDLVFNNVDLLHTTSVDADSIVLSNDSSSTMITSQIISTSSINANAIETDAMAANTVDVSEIVANTATFIPTQGSNSLKISDSGIIYNDATGKTGKIFWGEGDTYLSGSVYAGTKKYAGGTEVTLNGSSKAGSTASFYAPTSAGTKDYILKSNGSGAPIWVDSANLVAPKKITLVATAGQTSFSIPFEYDSLSSNLTVYFNGILMKETDNYTVNTSNNTVNLAGFSAEAGDIVTIMGLLGAQSIDFGQEAINAINQINAKVTEAKQEIDDKVQTAFTQIDAKIDEIETFINELPDDTTKLMAKNTNNTMESGYKITMASNYTPSGNYDVATKLYVDNKTSGMATQTYVNNQISTATASIVTDVFATGSTSPDNGYSGTEATKRRKLLWIDTGNSDPGLKYYNGSSWVTVPVRWS